MAPRGKNVKKRKFEQEQVEKALVRMIIIDELPFSVVEQEGFKECMEAAFPGFHIPSRDILSKDSAQLYIDEKLKLKSFIKQIKQRVCLTLDTWTSNQSVNYLRISAHFIDNNWNLQKKVLGFTSLCGNEGEEIGKVVEKCLNDWEIDNVLTISVGNGSSNDAAVTYLRERLPNTVLDGKFLHLKCVVDFTNNLVNGVLKEHENSISRVRAAVRYVLQSPVRTEKFQTYVRISEIEFDSSLCLDIPTRWNSTFEMLKASQNFEDVFNWFQKIDPAYGHVLGGTCGVPDYKDWKKVRKAIRFLGGFYQSIERISGLHVSSNQFLVEIVGDEFNFESYGKSIGASDKTMMMALEMKWNSYEYWGNVEESNMLVYVANILDPRRRTDFLEHYFMNDYKHEYTDDGEKLWKKKAEFVISATYDLFNEYLSKIGETQQKANFETSGYKNYLYEDTSHIGLFQKHEVGFGGNAECLTDIDIYLNEDSCRNVNGFDILLWWKRNSARYPVLSKMAKDVLAIPISAVAPESAFSTNGSVLDDFRSSLSPEIAEGLVCTQDRIRKPRKKFKVQEGSLNLNTFAKGMYEQLQDAT